MEEIFEFLSTIRSLSPECIAHLIKVVQFQQVKKDDVLLKIGDINERLYFIKKGALHCFYYVGDKLVYDWFFFETETVVSIGSFYDQLPSGACIVALEDSELFYITYKEYKYLKNAFPEFCYIASELLEKYLVLFHEHAIFIRKIPALMRCQLIHEKRSYLFNRVPLVLLASWLNMAPETLSRMRNALAHPGQPHE